MLIENLCERIDRFHANHSDSLPTKAVSKLVQVGVCETFASFAVVYHMGAVALKTLPAMMLLLLERMGPTAKIARAAPDWMKAHYMTAVHLEGLKQAMMQQPTILTESPANLNCTLAFIQLFPETAPIARIPTYPSTSSDHTFKWLAGGLLLTAACAYVALQRNG